jgi:malonate transporter and related proteins
MLGYLLGNSRLFGPAGIEALMNFIYYLAIPALLFRTLSKMKAPVDFSPNILFGYYTAAFLLFAIAMVISKFVFRRPVEEQAMFAMGATYGNNVMLGLAVIQLAYGEKGMLPVLAIIGLHPIIMMSLPMIFVESRRAKLAGGGGWRALLLQPLKGILSNPIIVSMIAGIGWSALDLPMPQFIDDTLGLLGRTGVPCALFAVGASLTQYKIAGDMKDILLLSLMKLFVFPAMVWFMTWHVFDVEPLWAAVATILAAMPTGANVFILAQHYGVFTNRAAAAVVVTTSIAWITIALLLAFLPVPL